MKASAQQFTCKDSTEIVSESRDRQLTRREDEQLQEHLLICHNCSIAYRQFHEVFNHIDQYLGKNSA